MERTQQITQWLETLSPQRAFTLTPASADASFRRYFRATYADGATAVIMDAPPDKEDCRPWLKIQSLFAAAGAHVPAVPASDLERGFLLLSDLGQTTYLSALNADTDSASQLYSDATDALIAIQLTSRPGELPEYDRALLRRELDLFPEWFLGHHHRLELTAAERERLETVFERILAINLAEPRVFVHRDYHSRNLMLSAGGNPGIVDFQDAVYGPISYDLVSLFKDAYIAWDEEQVLDWLIRYWQKARAAGLPVHENFAEFHRDYEWMGVQRHIKVLGIFARLYHRDGKSGYLQDMPRVARYLRQSAERYIELKPILRLLDRCEERQAEVGYTF